MARATKIMIALALAVLCLLSAWAVQGWILTSLTIALARAVVLLGMLNLFRSGQVSFGQALFPAIGGYCAAMSPAWLSTDLFAQALLGGLSASVVGLVMGFIIARFRKIFFSMLTLASSMMFFGLLAKSLAFGGTDGLNVARFSVLGWRPTYDVGVRVLYGVTCLLSLGAALAMKAYFSTTLGKLSTAVRDNEIRLEYLGFSASRAIHIDFVIGAALGGIGGVLTAAAAGHVDPDLAYWTSSGELVFAAIMSGTGSVIAPFAGSILFEAVRSSALEIAPQGWHMILGAVLLTIILFLPGGLWSLYAVVMRKARAFA
jgi:ABC-type branched-subunit amino acid transport system permease subunit